MCDGAAKIWLILSLVGTTVAAVPGCGRYPLLPATSEETPVAPINAEADAALAPVDAPVDASLPLFDVALDTPPPPPPPPKCVPNDETCNGKDDDCDGRIDQDIAAIPCSEGGYRYCIAGSFSACPTRCDLCVPGSQRVCYLPYCTFWGRQDCTSDGKSFGSCKEDTVPAECKQVANDKKRSADLERCCIDNGYCCLDEFDLDADGDHTDMLGSCGGVQCTR